MQITAKCTCKCLPLTDEEITEIFSTTNGLDFYLNFARAIEAAHGIKGEAK